MSLVTFTSLAGAPVHYDRYDQSTGFGYGTRGKPFRPRASARMLSALEACMEEVFSNLPWGTAEVLTSAGAYVDKPGHHGRGQAFDLDGLFWAQSELVADQYPSKPHFYLAVESIIRKHFGTVLAYNYNLAHRDHFHLDIGTSVGFQKMSKSRVEYLQSSLFYVHGYQLSVDGVWGPSTETTTRAALKELQIDGNLASKESWLDYLSITAKEAAKLT